MTSHTAGRRNRQGRQRATRRAAWWTAAGVAVSGAAVAVGLPSTAAPVTSVPARNSDSFVDSIGVNTHLAYPGVYTTGIETITTKLQAAGIRHVRDGSSAAMPALRRLYDRTGIRSTVIVDRRVGGDRRNALDPSQVGAELAELRSVMGPAVAALESPNEYDIAHGVNDRNWVANLRSFVTTLHAEAAKDPVLSDRPVLGPSLTSGDAAREVGNLSSVIDYCNVHHYLGGRPPGTRGWGDDGYGSIPWARRVLADPQCGSEPWQITESGYHNAVASSTGHQGAPESVEASYLPRMFLEYFTAGVTRAFKYEFVDEGSGSATDPEQNFGLLRRDLSEKPSYVSLKNLIGLLADPGCTRQPGALPYALSGATQDVRQVLLQRCDGSFNLVLWQEVPSYDVDARKVRDNPRVEVDLALGNQAKVSVHEPLTSTAAVRTATTSALRLSVPDAPVVVRISDPTSTPAVPSSSPTPTPSSSPAPSPSSSPTPSPSSSSAPGPVEAAGPYAIVNAASGKVLDVRRASTADGASVQQWADARARHQRWTFAPVGDGSYELVNVHSGKRLDVRGASRRQGATLIQFRDTDGANQRFRLTPQANGTFVITAVHSGKVLEVASGSSRDGAKLRQAVRSGGAGQQWRLAVSDPATR